LRSAMRSPLGLLNESGAAAIWFVWSVDGSGGSRMRLARYAVTATGNIGRAAVVIHP